MMLTKGWAFPDLDFHFANQIEEYPAVSYQQAALDEALKHVKDFSCAVDVGANVGLHTVRFSQLFKNVHSFEPTNTNFSCLRENTKNISNVNLYNTGLGDEICSGIEIKLPKNSNNCGGFSIVDFLEFDGEVISENISIDKLDNFELHPGLIKIDVQGYDLNVLKGSLETLKNNSPVLLIEVFPKDLYGSFFELLDPLGYKLISRIKKDSIWVKK